MTSHGCTIMITIDTWIIWFHSDCFGQLKKLYYIVTNVGSRKSGRLQAQQIPCPDHTYVWTTCRLNCHLFILWKAHNISATVPWELWIYSHKATGYDIKPGLKPVYSESTRNVSLYIRYILYCHRWCWRWQIDKLAANHRVAIIVLFLVLRYGICFSDDIQ